MQQALAGDRPCVHGNDHVDPMRHDRMNVWATPISSIAVASFQYFEPVEQVSHF